jgi:hypothetical protein
MTGEISEAEFERLSKRGSMMLGGFAEAYAVLLIETLARKDTISKRLQQLYEKAEANGQELSSNENATYRTILKDLSETARIQLAAMTAGTKIDYRKKGGAAGKVEA